MGRNSPGAHLSKVARQATLSKHPLRGEWMVNFGIDPCEWTIIPFAVALELLRVEANFQANVDNQNRIIARPTCIYCDLWSQAATRGAVTTVHAVMHFDNTISDAIVCGWVRTSEQSNATLTSDACAWPCSCTTTNGCRKPSALMRSAVSSLHHKSVLG